MSELNGGADALGTAMLVSSLGGVGVGAALLLTPPPPPQPAKAAAATSNTVINGYFIERYPFVLTVCRSHGIDLYLSSRVSPSRDERWTSIRESDSWTTPVATEYCIQSTRNVNGITRLPGDSHLLRQEIHRGIHVRAGVRSRATPSGN